MTLRDIVTLSDRRNEDQRSAWRQARPAILTTILTTFAPVSGWSATVRRRSVCRLTCADGLRRTTAKPRPTAEVEGRRFKSWQPDSVMSQGIGIARTDDSSVRATAFRGRVVPRFLAVRASRCGWMAVPGRRPSTPARRSLLARLGARCRPSGTPTSDERFGRLIALVPSSGPCGRWVVSSKPRVAGQAGEPPSSRTLGVL
jgi:hypothetical protein